jgi:DNA-binding beta-propeller fold protein YncE
LTVALTFGASHVARAQDQGGDGEGQRQRRQRPSMADQLKDLLGLTDDQVAKVKAIDDDMRAAFQKARDEAQGDFSQMREKLKPIMDKARADVRALLTKEQQPKFDEWSKQQDERRNQRGQGRQGQGQGQGGDRGGRGGQDQGPTIPATKPEKEILLGQGGFDYLKADAASRKLYVAHSSTIDVIDMDKLEKIGQVEGVDGAHGTAIVADQKRGFATAGRKQKVIVFDTDTNKVIKEVDTGQGPDALLYASSVGEVWTMNHRGGNITCVDAKSLEVTKTIDVGGTLEFCAEDAAKGIVYVNVEDKSTLVAIDTKKHAVSSTWQITPGEEPAGLAFDAKDNLLFVGCGNKKLVAVDAATGKIVSSFDIGSHCDACAFDDVTGTVYASCADASTSVIRVKDAKTFEAQKPIGTARGGKTCAIDTKTHRLFVAVAPRRNEQGESKILVYATETPSSTPAPDKTFY